MKDVLQLLLIDADEERAERLRAAFSGAFVTVCVKDRQQAEIVLAETGFDAVLCSDPVDGAALSGRAMQILTLGGEPLPGVYRLSDESDFSLAAAAQHVAVTKDLLGRLTREKVALQKKLEDMALVNRAKAVLCRTLGFSEDQAHKYLEKQAMTLRITKTEAARRILATYEN